MDTLTQSIAEPLKRNSPSALIMQTMQPSNQVRPTVYYIGREMYGGTWAGDCITNKAFAPQLRPYHWSILQQKIMHAASKIVNSFVPFVINIFSLYLFPSYAHLVLISWSRYFCPSPNILRFFVDVPDDNRAPF